MPNLNTRRNILKTGIRPFDFNPALATFTPSMAKRTTAVFNAAPIAQGNRDGTGTPDIMSATRGSQVFGNWYGNLDSYQGTIVFWITPEWNGNDGYVHEILKADSNGGIQIEKTSSNALWITKSNTGQGLTVGTSSWVAGTTYCVVCRWDSNNTLDGTNYMSISINDAHTFGQTSALSFVVPTSVINIGESGTTYPANAIIQGLTIYRRPLYDGLYGTDVGNGDEINLIYAAGTGKDPTLVTGSWDVVFALPTNGTAGALVTGTGEAWSHPHSSNVLKNGWMNDGFYGGGAWAVKFNGSTTKIDCGKTNGLDDLHDGAITAETWFRQIGDGRCLLHKGGWFLYLSSISSVQARVSCVGGNVDATGAFPADSKYHHIAMTFDDGGDRKVRVYVDGKLIGTSGAGSGAIVSDVATNFTMGSAISPFIGYLGWTRLSNSIRYSTDFVPARTPPAVDANTIAQWNMTEGTGTTVDNAEGTASRDGTITSGTWEEQWQYEGTPKIVRSVEFNGTTTKIDCGSDAKLDNLHDGAMTVECYARIPPGGNAFSSLISKIDAGTVGWIFNRNNTTGIKVTILCATTNANAAFGFSFDNKQHHWAFTWDDAGDRKIRIYIDRVLVATSNVGVGAVISDAAETLKIGMFGGGYYLTGGISWVRISNVVRDIPAETYTRETAPVSDANTMLLLTMTEGTGNPVDTSGSPATCTLTNGVWNNTPDMATDSPGARIYNWGEVFGSDAANEGIKQTLAVTAGAFYRIRALGYSEDGIGKPRLVIYDETNAATIRTMDGTTTSLEQKPDVFESCFQVPVGCTSLSFKLLNATATGVVGWHKAVLLSNLWADPGFEVGTAPTDVGTPTTSAQSNEQAHSGTYSWKVVADAVDEGIKYAITVVSGKYYAVTGWVYPLTSGTVDMQITGAICNDGKSTQVTSSGADGWKRLQMVVRATSTTLNVIFASNAAQTFYVDDAFVRLIDDVSITCTPASLANSTEGTGIRVDGWDGLIQPVPVGKLKPTKGRWRWKWTPRHGSADFMKFGQSVITLLRPYGDASNMISLAINGINSILLSSVANGITGTGTWNCTGLINAGTTYTLEVYYTSTKFVFKVDGVVRISINMTVLFTVIPTIYAGSFSYYNYQNDSVISPP
jgi:hypothetical protein